VTAGTLEVAVEFAGLRRERPPLVWLHFDVQLRNGADGPRWLLLPDRLDGDEPWPGDGVSGVDLFELPGERPPLLAQFAASHGGFQGVRLQARGEASLRRVPIRFWGDPLEQVELGVVLAGRLEIDGEDVGAWLGGEVESPAGASEYPLEVDVETRRRVAVALRRD
jgi:hypothetical protein